MMITVTKDNSAPPDDYWEARKDILYYQVVRALALGIGRRAKSIIDVGSAGCPYLDWLDFIPKRSSIDLKRPYFGAGVDSFSGDFLTWQPDQFYDLVLCLQVLEHVPKVEEFARKLLSTGSTVIISVPYKWEHGRTESHIHDPVDEDKLLAWFGREANFQYVIREVKAPVERLIQVYDPFPHPWSALNRRDALLK